jgi:hypothetical protein
VGNIVPTVNLFCFFSEFNKEAFFIRVYASKSGDRIQLTKTETRKLETAVSVLEMIERHYRQDDIQIVIDSIKSILDALK